MFIDDGVVRGKGGGGRVGEGEGGREGEGATH